MPAPSAEEDYYAILGLEPGATLADINSAYRKRSLKVHPDRYKGDDPEAATEEFLRLTRAKEVLSDDKARAAYEALRKARDAHKAKQEAQHAGRKKMREELEEREEAAKRRRNEPSAEQLRRQEHEAEAAARRELEQELDRLRSSGKLDGDLRQRAKAAAASAASAAGPAAATTATGAAAASASASGDESAKLSLRWAADNKEQFTSESLGALLAELGAGAGLALAVVKQKAVLELSGAAAKRLMARSVELAARGVRASYIGAPPADAPTAAPGGGGAPAVPPLPAGWKECKAPDGRSYFYHTVTRKTQWSRPAAPAASAGRPPSSAALDHEALESVTMMRLRQAGERQKMAEALAADGQ